MMKNILGFFPLSLSLSLYQKKKENPHTYFRSIFTTCSCCDDGFFIEHCIIIFSRETLFTTTTI